MQSKTDPQPNSDETSHDEEIRKLLAERHQLVARLRKLDEKQIASYVQLFDPAMTPRFSDVRAD